MKIPNFPWFKVRGPERRQAATVTTAPVHLPAPDAQHLATPADSLNYLCDLLTCTYERWKEDSKVYIALVFPDTTRIVGTGRTTLEAIADVSVKAGVRL